MISTPARFFAFSGSQETAERIEKEHKRLLAAETASETGEATVEEDATEATVEEDGDATRTASMTSVGNRPKCHWGAWNPGAWELKIWEILLKFCHIKGNKNRWQTMFFLDFKPLVASSLQRQSYLMTGCVTKWSVDYRLWGTRIFGKIAQVEMGRKSTMLQLLSQGFRGIFMQTDLLQSHKILWLGWGGAVTFM